MIGRMDTIVAVIGVCYGAALILAAFVSNKFTEALRIDTFLFPNANQNTRMLNLVFGLLVFGYSGYSLLKLLF